MRSILQHLRLPFSFFLMPVFWFVISQSANPDITKAVWSFIILHIFVYPASNAYNSYFDKDEGPIGGIEKPLPVAIGLYWIANLIDLLVIIISYITCGLEFTIFVIIYIIISKAYSHPWIRLKKFPFLSWFIVGFFQGAFIYFALYNLINSDYINISQVILPCILVSLNFWAFYPITQIYQHVDDLKRGDITMSLKLGKQGTFIFTGLLFAISSVGFYIFFKVPGQILPFRFFMYILTLLPSIVFFNYWAIKSWKNATEINFKNTMKMNILGSVCMNIFFIILIFLKK